jgi:hypothetical protein
VNWLDTLLDRGREAKGTASSDPLPVLKKPAKPPVQPDIKAVSVQTAAPFGNSPGAITVGFYSVQDDVVVVRDESGIPIGKRQHLRAGEDPRGVAYRLTREAWQAKAPDFNRALNYQPLGIA